jgi:hypothetical protein
MATVPTTTPKVNKAFRCTIFDEPGTLGKVADVLYFFAADGRIEPFEPEMAPWTCILGEIGLSECQALTDRRHGGRAWIATHRLMEVQ